MTYAPVLPGMYDSAPTLSTPTVGPAACSDRHVDILLARVEAKANADSSGFTLKAARFILQYLAAHGATCGEVITDAAKVAGVRPLNDKHFGPVYQRLAQSGAIRKAGYAPRTKGHMSGQAPVWEIGQ